MPRFAISCLLSWLTVGVALAADRDDPRLKQLPANQIVTGDKTDGGLTPKLRSLLGTITTDDPLRIALHFDQDGQPIDHLKGVGRELLNRTGTLTSLDFEIIDPRGGKHQLQSTPASLNARQTTLYNNPTFLLELAKNKLVSLQMSGQPELAVPWPWEGHKLPGTYKITVTGKLLLETPKRKVNGKLQPAQSRTISFEVGPLYQHVIRQQENYLPLDDLEQAAVKAIEGNADVIKEKLQVRGTERLTITDKQGNRVVRVAANKPPKPQAKQGGIIRIAGGGGLRYYRYEVVMTPAGKPVSVARQPVYGCLAEGTKIDTPAGTVSIDNLKAGDRVWAYDTARRKRVVTRVEAVRSLLAYDTVKVGQLRLTPDHPVYAGGQWKPAGQLTAADKLLHANLKPQAAVPAKLVSGPVTVFDVMVKGPHNFFAGGVLVHNKSIAWTPEAFVPWYALWSRVPQEKDKK